MESGAPTLDLAAPQEGLASSNVRVAGILIARLDSARLPGKALLDLGGHTLIGLTLARAAKAASLDSIALATTDRPCDTPLVVFAEQAGIPVFRGPAEDVATRVATCATHLKATHFARINGDSPFVDPALIDLGVRIALESGADFVTNLKPRSYPYGVAVEIMKLDTFLQVLPDLDASEREHITQVFYRHPDRFKIESLPLATREGLPGIRLTVDEPDDATMIRRLFHRLGPGLLTAGFEEVASAAQMEQTS